MYKKNYLNFSSSKLPSIKMIKIFNRILPYMLQRRSHNKDSIKRHIKKNDERQLNRIGVYFLQKYTLMLFPVAQRGEKYKKTHLVRARSYTLSPTLLLTGAYAVSKCKSDSVPTNHLITQVMQL